MRTIAIINQKGGCGKTTVSINLAAVLAQRGHRTLLVDMDPQGHCALGLAVPESQIEVTTADLLRAGLDGTLSVSDAVWQISRCLDLVPSTMALAGMEQELAQAPDRDRRLRQILSVAADAYEFCILDCPPSIGLLTFNALRAAAEVITPVETGYFALQGSFKQEATIAMLARRVNHHARFRVLATMYDVRTRLSRDILTELRKKFDEKLLPVVVHFNTKLREAASFGQPITEYDPGSRGFQDFDRLATWLLTNPPTLPGQTDAAADQAASPALSRAAELVERAKALAARTQALSAQLQAHRSPEPPLPAESAGTLRPIPADPVELDERDRANLQRVFGVRSTRQGLLFIQPAEGGRRVAIAGDFNGWKPENTPMQRDDQTGVWKATVTVQPGKYRYRLVVDGKWVHDPYNRAVESNPYGDVDNIVEVPA